MKYLFKNEIVEYDFLNNKKKDTILFLHGWGGNKLSFSQTVNLTKKDFNIFTITLPTTAPTVSVWNMFDYSTLVENILTINNIFNPIIICHSFGLRVAMLLNKKIKFKKIVITGGAGIKKINIFSKIIKNNNKILLKITEFKYLFEKIASFDYKILNCTNKKSFINIVNLNLKFATKFSCPVLLFWGTKDKDTSIWIAKQIKKQNNAQIITTKGSHFAYLTDSIKFNHETLNFIKNA